MGLFEKLGREVEKFKQTAVESAEDEASYRCADCGASLYTAPDACPECGGPVEAVEPVEASPDRPGEDATDRPEEEATADAGDATSADDGATGDSGDATAPDDDE